MEYCPRNPFSDNADDDVLLLGSFVSESVGSCIPQKGIEHEDMAATVSHLHESFVDNELVKPQNVSPEFDFKISQGTVLTDK